MYIYISVDSVKLAAHRLCRHRIRHISSLESAGTLLTLYPVLVPVSARASADHKKIRASYMAFSPNKYSNTAEKLPLIVALLTSLVSSSRVFLG
jgi:hypothetical protein